MSIGSSRPGPRRRPWCRSHYYSGSRSTSYPRDQSWQARWGRCGRGQIQDLSEEKNLACFYAFHLKRKRQPTIPQSFNPCFLGSTSACFYPSIAFFFSTSGYHVFHASFYFKLSPCFNPCFLGSTSAWIINVSFSKRKLVSIIVFMDRPLREPMDQPKTWQNQKSIKLKAVFYSYF